ncbi:uncharacterized protein LOC108628315 [Ceratina calcarata]|uniref:Uncharacterized protein LOC108628315 n=1 Tax=Ceratina calcarata TaxID=156304 RepID=A0AAJ7S7T3_9HYME|nr:uncharacterized protein LOC108628315 [Ceratina calcarata]
MEVEAMIKNQEERISCKELVKALERDVAVLRIENQASFETDQKLNRKLGQQLEKYNIVSLRLSDKLDSLWSLARTHHPDDSLTKHFADHVSTTWAYHNRRVFENSSKLRLPSHTVQGAFLCSVKDKIKKRLTVSQKYFDLLEPCSDPEDTRQARDLINEAWELICNLEQYDNNLQQHLSMSSLTPRLLKLDRTIDVFVFNCELLRPSADSQSLQTVFKSLADMLTGKLLGDEAVAEPSNVCTKKVYRKPVFIFRNIKNKPLPSPSS